LFLIGPRAGLIDCLHCLFTSHLPPLFQILLLHLLLPLCSPAPPVEERCVDQDRGEKRESSPPEGANFVQSLAESQSFLSRVSSSTSTISSINHYRRSRANGSAVPVCTPGFTMPAAIQNPFDTVPLLIKLRNCPLFYGVQMHWGFYD
jgi:hypothetical protein